AAAVPPGQQRQEHQEAADAGADEGHRAADDLEPELPQAVAGQIAHRGAPHHADYPDHDPNSRPHSSLSSLIGETLVRTVLTSCSRAAQRSLLQRGPPGADGRAGFAVSHVATKRLSR